MKTGAKINRGKTVMQAYADLEKAARTLVVRAEWHNPYSVLGPQYKATIRELKGPLVELAVAKRMAMHAPDLTTKGGGPMRP